MNKETTEEHKEHYNIVIVGHVDHGKSTLIGRLFADTDSLADGKLDQVKEICRQQGKEFEYAFLFDALIEEQEQGITIDTARTFFSWKEREYILIDAPGHKEFLKNMISGAARAESALLLIDANEGIMAQSKQHGYMLSLLGITQIAVIANKMDIVGYDQATYKKIEAEYREFLKGLDVTPAHFIPVSAKQGDNIASKSSRMPWYDGPTVLEALENFKKEAEKERQPLRFPVQDVYKFDSRRVIAGRITSGVLNVDDRIVFSPSNKSAFVKSIERFNVQPITSSAKAGESIGITLDEQLFIERGEIASHAKKAPILSSAVRCNIFWMGKDGLRKGKRYKMRLATQEVDCDIAEIHRIIDANNLDTEISNDVVKINEVAEITIHTKHPIAFDFFKDFEDTGRFVLVDRYDVSGGGIITHAIHEEKEILLEVARRRDYAWVNSEVSPHDKALRHGHREGLILLTGAAIKESLSRNLERKLFKGGRNVYLLDYSNLRFGLDADISDDYSKEMVRRFAESAYLLMKAGLLVVSALDISNQDYCQNIKTIVHPSPMVMVNIASVIKDDDLQEADLVVTSDSKEDDTVQKVINLMSDMNIIF